MDIYFHFAWKVCRSKIAESCGKFVFSFLRKCLIISQSDLTICISTNKGWVFQFLHIFTDTCYCLSLSVGSVLFSHSVMSNFLWPMDCSTPGFPAHRQLPELKLIFICNAINHLIFCRPLLLLPLIIPSIKVFSNESVVHIRWPKYWNFSFSISPSNDYSGLISSRKFWFDLLAIQGTLKSLLQHHSLKVSILQHSAFFMVQHLHLYMTTGKTVAWTIQTTVNKVISPLFNTLSRFIIAFFPIYIHTHT